MSDFPPNFIDHTPPRTVLPMAPPVLPGARLDPSALPPQPATSPAAQPCGCKGGAGTETSAPEPLVYALGKLDIRFSTVGLEREFEQRARALGPSLGQLRRGEQLHEVLRHSPHLARRACFTLSIGHVPAYVVAPTAANILAEMLEGLRHEGEASAWTLVIGRRGPVASPSMCGGLLAPLVACDQLYTFHLKEWTARLVERLAPVLEGRSGHATTDRVAHAAADLFARIASSTENTGATDAHRALNYLLMQHPGLALAVAERKDAVLDRIEVRALHGDLRRLVAVIFTFLDRATGVPERLFCRVDITEEWPFLLDSPLALLPFVDNELIGAGH